MRGAGLLKTTDTIEGISDTTIAARVLCGVPELEESLSILYALLKPGGKVLIVEHVVNPWKHRSRGSVSGRFMQLIYGPFWESFIRYHLNADTEALLRKVGQVSGGWQRVDLQRRAEWSPLPWIGRNSGQERSVGVLYRGRLVSHGLRLLLATGARHRLRFLWEPQAVGHTISATSSVALGCANGRRAQAAESVVMVYLKSFALVSYPSKDAIEWNKNEFP